MSANTTVEKNEYSFTKNINFLNTPLNEVKVEYMRKKIQLNFACNIKEHSTDNLSLYVLEIEEHIKDLESKIEKHEIDYKDSMKICNFLIVTSIFVFISFGAFSMLTRSIQLSIITLINGFVLGILFLYKKSKNKNIQNI